MPDSQQYSYLVRYSPLLSIKKKVISMKRIILLSVLIVCCYTALYALPKPNRNSFMMGIDGLFGQLDSSEKPQAFWYMEDMTSFSAE